MTNHKRCDAKTRENLANDQRPYAVILSCSDSRVPPEMIFDQGLGEIFVVRSAGHVVEPALLGSIEFAVAVLGASLVMVLGHSKCGAVASACDHPGEFHGNLGALLQVIVPAVAKIKDKAAGKSWEEKVAMAIDENIKLAASSLTERSNILKRMAEEGRIQIIKARYDLDTGVVKVLKDDF
ncbi:MAG: hypothetical protein LBV07_04085 [Syntrophobacterales bacterium]|nr:hypothetical protein [Syntrophobacterales bacterium]